jgi:concanavalin A-like lectin/glucanase superfamily protein/fibronectin type III domain protein
MGSHQKKKKRTKDTRAVTSEIKRQQDLDANRLAIQPTFEGSSYAPRGVGLIEFCNVSTSIVGGTQTNAIPPGQVTGLSASPQAGSDTAINLTWSAVTNADTYNVYMSTVTGFTPSGANLIASAVTLTSYQATSLIPGTTYYFKVSAVSQFGEGAVSTQASATTTGTVPAIVPSLWLPLNNSLADSSGNANTVTFVPSGGNAIYGTPGKFGSHYAITNYPTTTTIDSIKVAASTSTALDLTSVGFSFSFWFYIPTGSGTGSADISFLLGKYAGTGGNDFVLLDYYSSAVGGDNTIRFNVCKSSTNYVRKSLTAVTFDTWHHVVCTFNAATNTPEIYYDKAAGAVGNASGFSAGSSTDWRIGHESGASTNTSTFRGRFDEFQYFKGRVLNQTQVNNLFNNNAP